VASGVVDQNTPDRTHLAGAVLPGAGAAFLPSIVNDQTVTECVAQHGLQPDRIAAQFHCHFSPW